MKQNKKLLLLKRILILVVLVGIAVGCTVRIVAVNRKYPNPEIIEHRLQEPFTIRDLEVTVMGYQLLTVPEIQAVIPSFEVRYVDAQGNDKDERMLVVEIQLFNPDPEASHYFSPVDCILRSGADHRWYSQEFFSAFNSHLEDPYSAANLAPGESVTMYIPYHILQIHFRQNDWDHIETRTFELVFSWYPVKQIVTMV